MTVREQLAKNLAIYRKQAGYTQKAAAVALGTKLTTISSWERGVSQPSADMLVTIAMTYKVSLSDLCGMDYKSTFSAEDRELVNAYHNTDDSSRDVVRRILGIGGKIETRERLDA